MDQFDELVMLFRVHDAHQMTFPELVYPLILKCPKFIKVCKMPNFVQVIRGLLEKVQENVKLIEERREKTGLNIKDPKQMVRSLRLDLNPVHSFCFVSTRINGWREVSINCHQVHWSGISKFERYKSMRQREVLEDIAEKEKVHSSTFRWRTRKRLIHFI
jgi:hypothetical protein